MSRWSKVAIVIFNTKLDQHKDALAWGRRYSVPKNMIFTIEELQSKVHKIPMFKNNCLSSLSLDDKLLVFAHGGCNCLKVDGNTWYPTNVAHFLHKAGLKRIGLISFKVCYSGLHGFLDNVKSALQKKGVNVGWLIGYKDKTRTTFDLDDDKYVHELVGDTKNDYKPDLKYAKGKGSKRPDSQRVTIVQGNVKVEKKAPRGSGLPIRYLPK